MPKKDRHRADGELFSLDIPSYRTLPVTALTRHVDCLLRVVSGTIISPSQRGRLTIMHRASVLAGLIVLFKGSQPLPAAQVKATHPAVVTLPRPAVSRIPSPNGRWTLIFECPNDCSERKLWLEEKVSHTRKLVKEYDRSLSISWSPDSHLFFVNDASGSTETRCYVYDPATLKETDLARVVLTGDPDAAQFLNAGHSYLEAKQWVNSHELLVLLEGHNDGAPPGSFTLRYRVDLSGTVRKLSQHSEQ